MQQSFHIYKKPNSIQVVRVSPTGHLEQSADFRSLLCIPSTTDYNGILPKQIH